VSTEKGWEPAIIGFFGPMYSDKTNAGFSITYAVERATQFGIELKVAVVRPSLDDRQDDPNYLTNHLGAIRKGFKAVVVDEKRPWEILNNKQVKAADVVIIEEVQFFRPGIGQLVMELHKLGKRVYLLGLDLDFLGKPFPAFRAIKLALGLLEADQWELNLLTGICHHCGRRASHSLRFIGGQLAPADSGTFATEGSQKKGKVVSYMPVCQAYHRKKLEAAGIEVP